MAEIDFNVADLYTSQTTGIKISDLTKIEDSASNLSQKINISCSELYDKPFWFQYNGNYYYYKEISKAFRLLNELLGEYFSEYMDLPTIKYDIALSENGIAGVLSKNFREQNKKYINASELPFYYYAYIDYLFRFVDGNNDELKRKLGAIIVKDIFTHMRDRYANTICTLDNHSIDIAPLFDYEYSFSYRDISGFDIVSSWYSNPLFMRFPYYDARSKRIDMELLKKMIKRDKRMMMDCERMFDADIKHILEEIGNIRKINIPDEIIDYYKSFYESRKDTIMKVLK